MTIHYAVCIPVAWILLTGDGWRLAAYLVCLLWHEGAHCLCARAIGYDIPEMEWTPFGAVARMEDWHHVPYDTQLLIALAGPLASLTGTLLCWAGLCMLSIEHWPLLVQAMKANLYLFLFNLIPVLPMDGGRILCSLLSKRWNAMQAAVVLARLGVWLGAGLTLFSLWAAIRWHSYNLSLTLTGCYLAYSAAISVQTTAGICLRSVIEKHVLLEKRGQLPVKWLAMDSHQTVRFAVRHLEPGCFHQILIVDPLAYRVVGQIGEDALQNAMLQNHESMLSELVK